MKRIFGAIVIAILAAAYYCIYAVDSVNKWVKSAGESVKGFVSKLYYSFADFCFSIGGNLFSDHLGLDRKMWSLIGFAICMVIILVIYFVITSLIARHNRKKKIERKRAEGDMEYEPSKFPLKRVLVATIGVGLVTYGFLVYALDPVKKGFKAFLESIRKISSTCYHAFEDFSYNSIGMFSKDIQGKLSPEMWALIVLIVFAIIFFVLYFLIFGLIAKHQKKAHERKVEAYNEAQRIDEEGPVEDMSALPEEPVEENKSMVTVIKADKTAPSDFYWKDYEGGRPIKRVILGIVLGVVLLAFLLLRFFNYFNSDTSYSIAAFEPIFKFLSPVFNVMDNAMYAMFKFGETNIISSSFMNGMSFSVMQLLDLIFWIVVAVAIVVIVLLICTAIVHIFRKKAAKKRAEKAQEEYITALTDSSIVDEDRLYASSKAGEQLGIPTSKEGDADIATIATISSSKLTASMADDSKAAEYIDDISEGVGSVVVASDDTDESIIIHETREPLEEELIEEEIQPVENEEVSDITSIDEEKVENEEHVINLYHPDVDVDVAACDIDAISTKEDGIGGDEGGDVADVIRFDEQGFAYLETVGPRRKSESAENGDSDEDIPETLDNVQPSFDSSRLVDDLVKSHVIIEPEFVKPYSPKDKEILIPINSGIPMDLIMSLEETEEDRKILDALEPFDLRPVEKWPDETPTDIGDNGALHVMLYDENVAIDFDRQEVQFAPVIEEVLHEKVEEEKPSEPKPVVKPTVAPLHPIKGIRPVDIKPIHVAPKVEETPVEEEVKPQIFINKPLHEIKETSKPKHITPINVDIKRHFDLKRFQVGKTYRGKLSSQEAFERGITTVAPTVAPVTATVDKDSPEWLRRKKQQELKAEGYKNLQTVEIEDGKPVIASKPEKVVKYTLRKSHKAVENEEPKVEVKEEKPVIDRPKAPIAPVKPVNKPKEEEHHITPVAPIIKPIVKPVAPIKKPESKANIKPLAPKKIGATVKPDAKKPIKPIAPIKPKK